MELRIYDLDLNRKGVIDNFQSLIWTRKYYESGTFEIYAPLTQSNIDLLKQERLVAKDGSIEVGIIESIELTDQANKKQIVVKGRFLSSLLERRLIKSTFSFNGLTEVAMNDLISVVEPIPNLSTTALNGFTDKVTFQATMKNLLTIMTKLSKTSNIGFRVATDFVNKKLTFETYKGIDRSASQSANNKVIFSENFENINDTSYSYNSTLYKTKVFVGGEGEGPDRVYVELGGGEGYDLREVFVDAKDIQSMEFSTNDEYLDALKQRGQEKLSSMVEVEAFDYQTSAMGNFKYKKDYDLGDIVTIRKESWGISLNKRITGIEEVYEQGGVIINPTLGEPIPESITWED